MNEVLKISKLCKSYKDFSLKNIDIALQKGYITGFIGPNGSGKTTTIKSILNIVKPDSGSISVFDMDAAIDELQIKSKLGIVLDTGHFYEDITLKMMKELIAPMYDSWEEAAYQNYMKRFRLPENSKIKELSKGMYMKYSLAIALSHGAELFIMDEPTSGLDPLIKSELLDMLREIIHDGGKTVFFSTHITSDLDKIADYLVFIFDGQIILQGEQDTIKETHAIVKGTAEKLDSEIEKHFIGIHKSPYGFEALTNRKTELKQKLGSNVHFEVPTIEDIMLYYTRGKQ